MYWVKIQRPLRHSAYVIKSGKLALNHWCCFRPVENGEVPLKRSIYIAESASGATEVCHCFEYVASGSSDTSLQSKTRDVLPLKYIPPETITDCKFWLRSTMADVSEDIATNTCHFESCALASPKKASHL